MAWVKIPAENHPVFLAALPKDRRISTLKMFGGVAAKVNGQMFAGLFARSFVVKLDEAAQHEALALDGATMFDPMGNGRIMRDTVHMPEQTFDEPQELRGWLQRSFAYASTLPPKQAKPKKAAKPKQQAKATKRTPRATGKVKPKRKPTKR